MLENAMIRNIKTSTFTESHIILSGRFIYNMTRTTSRMQQDL